MQQQRRCCAAVDSVGWDDAVAWAASPPATAVGCCTGPASSVAGQYGLHVHTGRCTVWKPAPGFWGQEMCAMLYGLKTEHKGQALAQSSQGAVQEPTLVRRTMVLLAPS